jgi:hypothetical protein
LDHFRVEIIDEDEDDVGLRGVGGAGEERQRGYEGESEEEAHQVGSTRMGDDAGVTASEPFVVSSRGQAGGLWGSAGDGPQHIARGRSKRSPHRGARKARRRDKALIEDTDHGAESGVGGLLVAVRTRQAHASRLVSRRVRPMELELIRATSKLLR